MSSLGDLTNFDADNATLPCGQYKIETERPCTVHALNNGVFSRNWITSKQPLRGDLIERITGIQFIASSHDQGVANDPSAGNWTWFEIGIIKGKTSKKKGKALTWMSHVNRFLSEDFGWDGDSLQVRVCARFPEWSNYAEKGYLVFNVGCETVHHEPIEFPLPDAFRPRDIMLAGPDQAIMRQLLEDKRHPYGLLNWNRDVPTLFETQSLINRVSILQADDESSRRLRIFQTSTFGDLATLSGQLGDAEEPPLPLVIFDADKLRIQRNISPEHLSWDKTVESLWHSVGLQENKFHLLIRLGFEGTIYRGPNLNAPRILIFEPSSAEGQLLRSNPEKDQPKIKAELEAAYIAGLTASLAKESDTSIEELCETQIKEAIMTGLTWSRRYAALKFPKDKKMKPVDPTWASIKSETNVDPMLISAKMETLQIGISLIFKTLNHDQLDIAARDIVNEGMNDVMPYVPTASFGHLVTADRDEIDGFRAVANSITNYLGTTDPQPLSIAVFGQPGAGKSFGVKQLIKTLLHGADTKELDYNLSQFQHDDDLVTLFETIRDSSMEGKLPVVYFDEFDTTFNQQSLYWLKYFLGPMKHGVSNMGTRRVLGRGIYIFIGGTATTLQEFKPSEDQDIALPANALEAPAAYQRQVPAGCEELEVFLTSHLEKPPRFRTVSLPTLNGYSDLQKILYDIRDETSAGNVPVIFFTDFGAPMQRLEHQPGEILGWLKYFLAPMQDGAFFHRGEFRPLGRAVFVFVESNSSRFEGFPDIEAISDADAYREDQGPSKFHKAKGPDFVSRLRGFVWKKTDQQNNVNGLENVNNLKNAVLEFVNKKKGSKPLSLGPNANAVNLSEAQLRAGFAENLGGGYINILGPNKIIRPDREDDLFTIRRAVLLHTWLGQRCKTEGREVRIERRFLNGLLKVPKFRHGTRSMEAILAMASLPNDSNELQIRGINTLEQVDLHVDWVDFMQEMDETLNETAEMEWHNGEINWAKRRAGGAYDPFKWSMNS
ncbi:hypothetical protein B0T10DRAFT_397392 [Thelonectria olida]|uniref:ATPase AAA-type core domain-containing protein n=1 Tax=Thelonectria olida TaxID=1576542 RepID=A0A9P8WDS1_9HYPO|nr:hypothetical protein B0T10DRAFT_397392 [Thelonectria olida]